MSGGHDAVAAGLRRVVATAGRGDKIAIINPRTLYPILEEEPATPTFYELFAGVGLVRDALQPLGWECIYANDIDATKEAIYRCRYPDDAHFERRDVWEVEAATLPRPVDLVAASFPCIDLSLAGNRKGLAGTHSGTFWAMMRLLDQLRDLGESPKALMTENVTGFLSSHDGRDFREAVQAVNERGYVVDAIQVSAEHYAQRIRRRHAWSSPTLL